MNKINKNQYIVKQINLSNGDILDLLCFKSKDLYISTSAGGIDHLYLTECNNKIIHDWSIPETCEGELINAHAVLKRDEII